MSRTSKLLTMASLVALVFTTFGGSTASAEESPRAESNRSPGAARAEVPVVWDAGLADEPRTDSTSALQACYDGLEPWDAGTSDDDGDSHYSGYIPGWDDDWDATVGRVPVYVASTRCNDVNLNLTNDGDLPILARVCFFPTGDGYWCNQGVQINPGASGWRVIATGVQNGTRFEVHLNRPGELIAGDIAY